MADKSVDIAINAKDNTKPAFDSVRRNASETQRGIDALKGSFGALSALAGSAGVGALLHEAVEAARQAEDSEKRLGAILKANGDTVGYTREQLEGIVGALEKSTTFDDEDIRGAQSQLVKFGNIHSDVFKQALKYSADYAALTGGSMTDAAQAVGKAFSDPINGATALEKQLGKLTAAEEAQIKAAMEQGRADDARAVIAAKLERQIGGLAEAMNSDLTGAITGTKKSWDNLLEAFGRAAPVKNTVEGVFHGMANVFDIAREALEKANKEAERSIFFQGKLAPLPPEVTGKKNDNLGLPPGMTIADVQAGSKGDQAKLAEEEKLRAETRAKVQEKLAAEEEKRKDRIFKYDIDRLQGKQDLENEYMKNAEKQVAEYEKNAAAKRDAEWELWEAEREVNQIRLNARAEVVAAEEQQLKDDTENRANRLISVMDDLRTERQIEDQHFIEQRQALLAALANNQIALDDASAIDEKMRAQHEKKITSIEDSETRKRTGAANVYRKVDLNSAGFFFDQMAGLMQTHSRKLFEIGKVAAIAGAITDTYKAATGAYAAMASIPYIGPALGAAAAAAAIAVGFARVQAIKSQSFGGGSGAVGTYAADPNTGLPDFPAQSQAAPESAVQQSTTTSVRRDVRLTIIGDGMISPAWVRDVLIPSINEAVGDGVTISTE